MQNGASAERVEAALGNYKKSELFSPPEKLALELCERMTYSGKRVTDRFFNRLKQIGRASCRERVWIPV